MRYKTKLHVVSMTTIDGIPSHRQVLLRGQDKTGSQVIELDMTVADSDGPEFIFGDAYTLELSSVQGKQDDK
jgi:hypothetical protein